MIKDNNKKTHYVVLGGKGGGQAESVEWDDILNKPEFATVATSGDYDDLNDKPTILTQWFGTQAEYDAIVTKDPNVIYNIEGSDNVQADWNQTDSSADDFIKNKPTIPAAQVNADWNADSGVSQILNKPSLATVATSGNYSDLNGTPTLATVATSGDYDDLTNKPTIPVVPTNVSAFTNDAGYSTFSGSYNDLTNKPTIPAAQVNADWNANSGVAQILNKPTLATVATTGSYNDLTDKPTVTQEQADWNQSDTTAVDYIKNKPTIPTVPAMATETLTFTLQGGTTKTVEFYTVPNYFYVEDISGSDNTLSITKSNDSAPTIEVFKSTDKTNWESMGTTSTTAITTTIPANGKLYLKATTNAWVVNPYTVMGNVITASGNHNVGGNIMSLLYGGEFVNQTTLSTQYTFSQLFKNNSKLVDASKLELPATTLTNYCYQQMFAGCTGLTTAPALPATTLATSCYNAMFSGCTSLTTAPALNATTLAQRCYGSMFDKCSSLTTAPALPATTLANGCYQFMFYSCTSLTTAPGILPATTLATECYSNMFKNCRRLTTAPALPATTLATECYREMFVDCRALTTAPALPATTLATSCYNAMFQDCGVLTTAPALPATTLTTSCYNWMFKNCTNLNNVTTYAQDISANGCLNQWLDDVSATGDFFNLGGATYPSGTSGIPEGWTEHTSL